MTENCREFLERLKETRLHEESSARLQKLARATWDRPPEQDARAVAARAAQWSAALSPKNSFESWLVGRVAVEARRLDRCAYEAAALRDRLALRVALCWDDDRRVAAERAALGLARDPAGVRPFLESTRHGCDWLIARWAELLAVLDAGGAWDDAQASRAADLLGRPASACAARAEVARLRSKLDHVLSPLDAADRALAEAGQGPDPDGALARVRRDEAESLRRIRWACSQLKTWRRDATGPGRRRSDQTPPRSGM